MIVEYSLYRVERRRRVQERLWTCGLWSTGWNAVVVNVKDDRYMRRERVLCR